MFRAILSFSVLVGLGAVVPQAGHATTTLVLVARGKIQAYGPPYIEQGAFVAQGCPKVFGTSGVWSVAVNVATYKGQKLRLYANGADTDLNPNLPEFLRQQSTLTAASYSACDVASNQGVVGPNATPGKPVTFTSNSSYLVISVASAEYQHANENYALYWLRTT